MRKLLIIILLIASILISGCSEQLYTAKEVNQSDRCLIKELNSTMSCRNCNPNEFRICSLSHDLGGVLVCWCR